MSSGIATPWLHTTLQVPGFASDSSAVWVVAGERS